jgi:hypothetical protein
MPGAQCTRSLVCKGRKHTSSHHNPAFPHPMVLTVSFVLSPVIGLFLSPSPANYSADLTPASRRQDHTTSPSAKAPFVNGTISVRRIPPRVRDDRDTPLVGRDGGSSEVICVRREAKYFCKWGWTTQITLIRFNKSRF